MAKEVKYQTIKEVLEKVEPMEAAIMILGGTAAANGVVPPMTALLSALTGGIATTEQWSGIPQGDWIKNGNLDWVTILFGTNPPGWVPNEWYEQPEPPAPLNEEQKAFIQKKIGLFCSGAVEAMIMYNLVKNPETFKTLIALPGQVLTAAQGLAKVLPIP